MTLQQLQYVIALDTHRNFVKASETCFVTQPTLSMQLNKLEEEIGCKLFDRKKSPLTPTATGIAFIEKARTILLEVDQMKELVSDTKDNISGTFKLGVIPTVAPYLIPKFIANFFKKYPDTNFIIEEITTNELLKRITNNTIDIGIAATPIDETNIREIPMYNEPFLVYAHPFHHLRNQASINPSDLNTEDLWLLNQGHCFREQTLSICSNTKHDRAHKQLQYESGSMETIVKLINTSGGFTLIPELSASEMKLTKDCSTFEAPAPSREISLICHKGFAKERLLEVIREEVISCTPKHFKKNDRFFRVKWK